MAIKNDYKINHQIVNNQFLTVGIVLEKKQSIEKDTKNYIYIPCAIEPPAIINGNIVIDHIDAYQDHIKDFETTIQRYTDINKLGIELRQILSSNNEIYGFLTNTLQFVRINPTINISKIKEEHSEWIDKIVNIGEYYTAEKISTITQEYDESKHKLIQNVRLETTYYNVFRSILRNIISNKGSSNKRDVIEEIIELIGIKNQENNYKISSDDKDKIKNKLKELMQDRIYFETDMMIYKRPKRYTDITSCITKSNGGHCNNNKLIIPDINLNNNNIKNSEFYYDKIIDELVRFPQVQKYMLEPNRYLNITTDAIKINKNEIIMLETTMRETLPNTIKESEKICRNTFIPYKNAIPQAL